MALEPIIPSVFLFISVLIFLIQFTPKIIQNLIELHARVFGTAPVPQPPDDNPSRHEQLPPLRNHGFDPCMIETVFPALVYAYVKPKLDKVEECAVCMEKFQDDENVRLLPMGNHMFHVTCIDGWLSSHTTCPICREDLASICRGKLLSKEPFSRVLDTIQRAEGHGVMDVYDDVEDADRMVVEIIRQAEGHVLIDIPDDDNADATIMTTAE